MACSFQNNDQLYILRTYDDVDPIIINTNFKNNIKFEWSNCGNLIALGGIDKSNNNKNESVSFQNEASMTLLVIHFPKQNKTM